MDEQFKGKQYDYRIIIESLGLCYHFGLSYRDCAKIMGKLVVLQSFKNRNISLVQRPD